MRVLVLVDGEHYPPVTRWALETARAAGHDIAAAILVGGIEKLEAGAVPDLGVRTIPATDSPPRLVADAIEDLRPEAVLDLSDEPVLGYRERMKLAAVALSRGVPYVGPDFRLDPPIDGPPLPVPTLAVIGTGKRTGKTAISAALARSAAAAGRDPIIVAMGRGGPDEPQVAEAGSVNIARLRGLLHEGRHAASDYLEDALTAGVTTIGARRAGGGLAGAPFVSNVRAAAKVAVQRDPGIIILEGSGASIPPIPWDAGVLVAPASVPPEYLSGYLGPFRLLLSDLVIFTMAGSSSDGLSRLPALKAHVKRIRGDARFLATDFQPVPLGEVRGRRAFFTTTAPGDAAARQVAHLESSYGCLVVGWSARLADRAGLAEDMDDSQDFDVLLTELKAAAVDVASERAIARGAEVVFVDNRPVVTEGDDLDRAFDDVIELAVRRAAAR